MISALLGLCIMYYFTSGARRKRLVLSVVPSRVGFLPEDGNRVRLGNVVSKKITTLDMSRKVIILQFCFNCLCLVLYHMLVLHKSDNRRADVYIGILEELFHNGTMSLLSDLKLDVRIHGLNLTRLIPTNSRD
jgi:hypothetical protein